MIFKIIAVVALLLSIRSCIGVWVNSKAIKMLLEIIKIQDLREQIKELENDRKAEADMPEVQ